MLTGRPAAVLLDMDGTLVDSDAAVERAWISWAAEYGLDPDAVLAVAHGSPGERTIRRMLPDLDDRAVARSVARQLEKEYDDLSDVVAAPGADALLAALRPARAAVGGGDQRGCPARPRPARRAGFPSRRCW